MKNTDAICPSKDDMLDLLENNILRYWMEKMVDHEYGGFYGRRDGHDQLDAEAPKTAILNARILWAFSAAYRVLHKEEYLTMATRAKDYIRDHFIDKDYGGVFWSVNRQGEPLNTKKHGYATGVTIYGLAEYIRATRDHEARSLAKKLFYTIESSQANVLTCGYQDAFSQNWGPMSEMRLSEQDEESVYTLNTHLRLLEAYTNLYYVWKDAVLASRLRSLIRVFLEKIIDQRTAHVNLFFNKSWDGKRNTHSYGHDMETAWVLIEAATALGDPLLLRHVIQDTTSVITAAREGLQQDGSMAYMKIMDENGTVIDSIDERHWWVQCENVTANIYLYRHCADEKALDRAIRHLEYIQKHLIDKENGEWFWSCAPDGTANRQNDKAGTWKDPCHNVRMCLQIIG